MNSIHRIGLTVAGLVTAMVVGGVFVVDGYTSAIAQNQTPTDAAAQNPGTQTPTDSTGPTIIYVRPTPTKPPVDAAGVVLFGVQATLPPTAAPAQDPTAPPVTAPQITPEPGDGGGSDD